MTKIDGVKIVEDFWKSVWQNQDVEAIDKFVVEDFVITGDGVDIISRVKFKEWVASFLDKINDFNFEVIETFQNEDGSRVASRWKVTGKNNGLLGSIKDQTAISFTGTAIWALNEDGKLLHNWVERSTWALAQTLSFK